MILNAEQLAIHLGKDDLITVADALIREYAQYGHETKAALKARHKSVVTESVNAALSRRIASDRIPKRPEIVIEAVTIAAQKHGFNWDEVERQLVHLKTDIFDAVKVLFGEETKSQLVEFAKRAYLEGARDENARRLGGRSTFANRKLVECMQKFLGGSLLADRVQSPSFVNGLACALSNHVDDISKEAISNIRERSTSGQVKANPISPNRVSTSNLPLFAAEAAGRAAEDGKAQYMITHPQQKATLNPRWKLTSS